MEVKSKNTKNITTIQLKLYEKIEIIGFMR